LLTTIFLVAVILFIFAVTSGSTKGWGSAYVLTPLVISLVIVAVFLWWETHSNPDDAVLPPRMWRYPNFCILVALALLPYFWSLTSFVNITSWWEQYYGWTAINTAVHFLPIGVGGWLISNVTGHFPRWFPHKYTLLGGLLLGIIATILLPFANSPSTYWSIDFPAFTIGTIGLAIIYSNSSIAIFSYTPPSVAGTVGAVFNCALQLGSAVGLAAVSRITNSVDKKTYFDLPTTEWSQHLDEVTKSMWKRAYKGRAASYWFLLGILLVSTLAVIVFFKTDVPSIDERQKFSETKGVEALAEKKRDHQ
jgi:MFS family permease